MRILYVHNDYASPSGEEHATAALADLMRSHGHEVDWFRRSSEGLHGSASAHAKAFFSGIHNFRRGFHEQAQLIVQPLFFPYGHRIAWPEAIDLCDHLRDLFREHIDSPDGDHLVRSLENSAYPGHRPPAGTPLRV